MARHGSNIVQVWSICLQDCDAVLQRATSNIGDFSPGAEWVEGLKHQSTTKWITVQSCLQLDKFGTKNRATQMTQSDDTQIYTGKYHFTVTVFCPGLSVFLYRRIVGCLHNARHSNSNRDILTTRLCRWEPVIYKYMSICWLADNKYYNHLHQLLSICAGFIAVWQGHRETHDRN